MHRASDRILIDFFLNDVPVLKLLTSVPSTEQGNQHTTQIIPSNTHTHTHSSPTTRNDDGREFPLQMDHYLTALE